MFCKTVLLCPPMMAMALAGCATYSSTPPASTELSAVLERPDGDRLGTATVRPDERGLLVDVRISGLTPGNHGIHIHTTGRCEGPDFASAGGHWNPAMRQHGSANPAGPHHGDLPNILIGADGRGTLSARLPGSIDQLRDADGAAIILHAAADDLRSDPAGNSGARIACGVLR